MEKIKSAIGLMLVIANFQVEANVTAVPTTVTTAEIITQGTASALNTTCLSWCFTGVCVWLKCVAFVCSTETSPRYKHNNPDLVVTVYDELGKDPWVEMNAWYASFQISAANTILGMLTPVPLVGGGHQVESGTHPLMDDDSLRFKEGSAYGHPMANLADYTSDLALCPSEATAFFPYFLSGVDSSEWRFGFVEMGFIPWLAPGVRTVGPGGFIQQWGSVFPRTGFIKQKDDPKAGAVVAQRIGNIVTGVQGIHFANHLQGNGYSWTVLPGELIENAPSTGVWQMIKPLPDSACYVFGENDVFSPLPWSTGRTTDDNGYAYALWRRYECCEQKGALISVIPANICL